MAAPAHLMRESKVETYFREQCEAHGAIVRKKAAAQRGWPDREVFWFNACTDLVELKRPRGGVFEPLQLRTHEKLRQRGHNVFVINTIELVDAYIRIRRAYWIPGKQLEHLRTRRTTPRGRTSPLRPTYHKNDFGVSTAIEHGSPRLPSARPAKK